MHAPGLVAAERLRRPRDARRPGADHRAADRLRRVARRSRRVAAAAHDEPLRAHPQGRGDVRDRRRRLERSCKEFPNDWPNLKALMGESANFRNAIVGSFPAVTACAHGTIGTGAFPNRHGVTGHNIRDEQGVVRKAYDYPGNAAARRHLDPDALRPLARGDGRLGRPDRLPGVAPRHDGLRRTRPARRRPAGRGVLGRGRHRDLAAAQPRPVPAARVDADRRATTSATSTSSPTRAGTPSSRPSDASRRAAARRSCGIRAT